jgi:chitin disaccharide deacetylase
MNKLPARRRVSVYLFVLLISSFAFGQAGGQTIQEKLGYPASARLLVIHADDFGGSHSINNAIIEALEHGWVTSASILVPAPWFPEAAQWAKAHTDMDLGIHLDLNSEWTTFRWGPVSSKDQVPSLLDSEGYFPLVEDQVAQNAKIPEVQKELRAQIDRARAWGVHLTHLDTHMATLTHTQQLFDAYKALGHEYDLPVLLERAPGEAIPPGYVIPREEALTDTVLQMVPGVPIDQWLDWYKKTLTPLKPGVYELIVHLASDDPEMRAATYKHPDWGAAWRQADFDMVRSTEFQQFLKEQGFILVKWKDLAKALPADYEKQKR